MNKIGIITIHSANNYGSVLQAYATQQIFTNDNTKGLLIDYQCPSIRNEYGISLIRSKKRLTDKIKASLQIGMQHRSSAKFENFKEKYYSLIPFDDIYEDEFQTFIVGSDQVWNYKITGNDLSYLLNFVKNPDKRCSFSSCFGIEGLPEKLIPIYRQYLSSFHYLAVRDQNSKRLIYELTGRDAEIVLDPTMLLPPSLWMVMMNTSCVYNDYILVYQIAHSRHLVSFAEALSQATGYKILSIKGSLRQRFNAHYIWDAGPQEFLSLIYNAKYVVTNSFHGTVFSIIFNKIFYTGLLPEALAHVNSRLIDLLTQFELEEQIIPEDYMADLDRKIDFTKTNQILNKEREKSNRHIEKILHYDN